MIDSERTVVASLIDPKTRPAALDVCEKTGLTTEMFADTKCRDTFASIRHSGPDVFDGYFDRKPAAQFSAPDISAAVAAIVAAYNAKHPKPPTSEEILASAGIVIEDAADFLKRKIQPPRWIVQDFIADRMKGDLCGGAKSMKTFSALQMAVCVAAGRNFLDVYHVTGKHTVAYLNLELFDWNAQERLNAQTAAAGLDIDAEELRGRLCILNMRANPAALRGERDLGACAKCPNKADCHGVVEKLCRQEHADRIVGAFCDALTKLGVELVIIDPRYKLILPGEDENTGDGLRGVLALRDKLARHFAVMIVTHDPKGDTAERKTTDRGAGSYTAGADFDFRLTIDRSKDYDEDADQLLYVVAAGSRARKTPPKVGVRFHPDSQIFTAEDGISTELATAKTRRGKSETEKTKEEAEKQEAYKTAALAVVGNQPPGNLLSREAFDAAVATQPGATLATNLRAKYRAALVGKGVLKETKERDPKSKTGLKLHGRTFVSTPDRIAAYEAAFRRTDSTDPTDHTDPTKLPL